MNKSKDKKVIKIDIKSNRMKLVVRLKKNQFLTLK